MREQLVGYLLGALDADEHQAVDERLKHDPELAAELERLRKCLEPLDACEDDCEMPCAGLAAKTFSYVMARVGPRPGQFGSSNQWRAQDIFVAGMVVVVAAMLVFPAISSSRYQAQIRGCQANLLHIGHGLLQYSAVHNQFFPEVPTSGNLAAAGVYAPRLLEAGLIEQRHVRCPASTASVGLNIPSIDELQRAQGARLRQLQREMGGSYGYSLGYVADGTYHRLRNLGRSTFALMSDAPSGGHRGTLGSSHHGVSVQNVLFEDGRVQLLNTRQVSDVGDDIFQNHRGHVAAGVDSHDSVIVSSETAPIPLPFVLDE
jgi:hypothetical protein